MDRGSPGLALDQHRGHVVVLRRAARERLDRRPAGCAESSRHRLAVVGRDDLLDPRLAELLAAGVVVLVDAVREQQQDVARLHLERHRRPQRSKAASRRAESSSACSGAQAPVAAWK